MIGLQEDNMTLKQLHESLQDLCAAVRAAPGKRWRGRARPGGASR